MLLCVIICGDTNCQPEAMETLIEYYCGLLVFVSVDDRSGLERDLFTSNKTKRCITQNLIFHQTVIFCTFNCYNNTQKFNNLLYKLSYKLLLTNTIQIIFM